MNRPTPVLPGPVSPRRHFSTGFTLIEMLVSLAITMIMMGAVVSLFGIISDSVSGSRSIIEMSERLRAARNRLQTDLQGATADMRPPLRPEADQGYLELIEGDMKDAQWTTSATASIMGDCDDVLMFTTRSRGEPFVGKFQGNLTVESQTAEVIYFCEPTIDASGIASGAIIDVTTTPPLRTYTLYRRVLLVAPGLTIPNVSNSYHSDYDVSARYVTLPAPKMIPNTLGDLTKRENRFGHMPNAAAPNEFPFDLNGAIPTAWPSENARVTAFQAVPTGVRYGDDILLTNVLSFDVQVFDPEAPLKSSGAGGVVLSPSDRGYASGTPITPAVTGAYADLGWPYIGATPNPPFCNLSERSFLPSVLNKRLMPLFPLSGALPAYTYDTWSLHYENNGVNDDASGSDTIIDEGSDGIDTDGNGIVDDPLEAETQAPFAAPLRGIKITIRVYEPSSKQVRQVTVVQDFLAD